MWALTAKRATQNPWERVQGSAGVSITATASIATTLASATVEALSNILRHKIADGTYAEEMRVAANGTDADSNVIEIWAKRKGDDYYTRMTQLTLTVGTGIAPGSRLWHDGMVLDVSMWPSTNAAWHDNNNAIARYYYLTSGYSDIVIIATTLGSTDLVVDIAKIEG